MSQVCFFSATLHSPQIRELSRLVCVNPTWVDLKGTAHVAPVRCIYTVGVFSRNNICIHSCIHYYMITYIHTYLGREGFESLPEAVHHVVYRVDPAVSTPDVDLKVLSLKNAWLFVYLPAVLIRVSHVWLGQSVQVRAITDGVHEDAGASRDKSEELSQELKETKQQLLVRIIDKYQVSKRSNVVD